MFHTLPLQHETSQALAAKAAMACDLSPHIPKSFTTGFLTALLDLALARKEWNKANPVSTAGSMPFVSMRIDNRLRESERLHAVSRCCTSLLEPEEFDILDLEIIASDLSNWLDEDMGQLERQALAIERENGL